ncbi:MAG: hypothetical protein ACKVU4_04910 [Phycisphaerales bacterium]
MTAVAVPFAAFRTKQVTLTGAKPEPTSSMMTSKGERVTNGGRSESETSIVREVARALLEQQGQFEYLCEVPLPDGIELADLVRGLRRLTGSGMNSDARLALARAAVEVCYEHEESAGLVVPFMRELGCRDEDLARREWTERTGPAVRGAIERWAGSVPELPWNYKYVGAVRIHAGVPRLLIPRYARMLFELACDVGLEAVPALTSSRLHEFVEKSFEGTRFATEFLSSAAGEEFIRSTAVVLSRAGWPGSTGLGARVEQEPGFHRGFLTALVDQLETLVRGDGRRPRRTAGVALWPQLVLVEEYARLAIRFPGLATGNGCRYTWNELAGRLGVMRSLVYLDQRVRYSDVFTGLVELRDNETDWSIRAWPRAKSEWALFDLDGRFLGSDGDPMMIDAGEYFLAAQVERAEQLRRMSGCTVRAELGPLDFGMATLEECDLLHVELAAEVSLSNACRTAGESSAPRLIAQGEHPLTPFARQVDVVLLPQDAVVSLVGWRADHVAQYRVTLEGPGGWQDETRQLVCRGDTWRLSLPAHPHVGTVRIEGRGRRAGSARNESTLRYAVWPPVVVSRSVPIMAEDEVGQVAISAPSGVEVRTESGESLPGNLVLQPPDDVACFSMRCGDAELNAEVRIPRASIRVGGSLERPVVIERSTASGSQGVSEHERIGSLAVFAAPRWGWKLYVRTVRERHQLFAFGDEAASRHTSGRYPLRWAQIVDALRVLGDPIGAFELEQCGRVLSLDAAFLDILALQTPDSGRSVPTGTPLEVATAIERLNHIQAGNAVDRAPNTAPGDALQRVLEGWATAAFVVFGDKERLTGDAARASRVIRDSGARQSPAQAANLLREWERLDIEGLVERASAARLVWPLEWQRRLAVARERLARASDIPRQVRELRASLGDGIVPPDVPDGLFNGLRNYRTAFTTRSIEARRDASAAALKQLTPCARSAPEPWAEVAARALMLTYLRRGYVSEFLRPTRSVQCTGCVAWIQGLLMGNGDVAAPEHPHWDIADLSPIADDRNLQSLALRGELEDAASATWLSLWLAWRDSERSRGHSTEQRLSAARRCSADVPRTLADHDRILKELETGCLVNWNE